MSARVVPGSLQAKGSGFRYQAWCADHADGLNTRTKKEAAQWVSDHNESEHKQIGT